MHKTHINTPLTPALKTKKKKTTRQSPISSRLLSSTRWHAFVNLTAAKAPQSLIPFERTTHHKPCAIPPTFLFYSLTLTQVYLARDDQIDHPLSNRHSFD